MRLGNNLFNARKKSRLSQEEVAQKLGVADKQSQSGNLMKPYRIFISPKNL